MEWDVCSDLGEFLCPSVYLLTASRSSISDLHLIVFSAEDRRLCPGRTPNTSWIWRGVNGAPSGAAAGSGHAGELPRPRFPTCCVESSNYAGT